MTDAVLTLNAGSSSIKFALFELADHGGLKPRLRGEVEGLGEQQHFVAHDPAGATLAEQDWGGDAGPGHDAVLDRLLGWIERHLGADTLRAVGHRVVHGGRDFIRPVLLGPEILTKLEALTPLAPLHQPQSLAPMRAILASRPGLPQVACFDTAFHHTMPEVVTRFALPFALEQEGIRRYGFHGLSYEFISGQLRQRLPHLADGRVVVAHLGNGASLCAMQAGRSIDTTMGFTALDGLVMGTRCGSIDPGVLLYLLQQKHMTPHALETLLYHQSGLLGVSGIASDMRALVASTQTRAKQAVELFVFHVARETAAMVASLGGLDGFIFTGGIGEHATQIQGAVCKRLRWLGVQLGPREPGETRLSAPGSPVEVHAIATDEEAMIGQHTTDVVAAKEKRGG